MTLGTLGFAFLAGVLSILSPCVLPLLPIVLGTAATEHRFGPLALAAGLALSFVVIGLFVASVGFSVGLDGEVFRSLAAVLLLVLGLVLILPAMQMRVAAAAGPASNWIEQRFGGFAARGLGGQFAVGGLLGAVWSPCVGPTLGAAAVLAARGEKLPQVALTMVSFGLGAAVPLLLFGLLSREAMLRGRARLMDAGAGLKTAMGVLLVVVGAMILSGLDKTIEAKLVAWSPDWLTALTTRF